MIADIAFKLSLEKVTLDLDLKSIGLVVGVITVALICLILVNRKRKT